MSDKPATKTPPSVKNTLARLNAMPPFVVKGRHAKFTYSTWAEYRKLLKEQF